MSCRSWNGLSSICQVSHNAYLGSKFISLKFIYSEKSTKFLEIFNLLLTVCTLVKSKVKMSLNFVAFSEYMNFKCTDDSLFRLLEAKVGQWGISSKSKIQLKIFLQHCYLKFIIILWKKNLNFFTFILCNFLVQTLKYS